MKNTYFGTSNITALRISSIRKNAGLTQKQFAQKISDYLHLGKSLSVSAISAYEIGRKMPSAPVLTAIGKLFGVSVDFLLGTDTTSSFPEAPETGNDEPFKRVISFLAISPDNYKYYDKKPVFVTFPNKTHADQWGIIDYDAQRILCPQFTLAFNECVFSLFPFETYDYNNGKKRHSRPLGAATFQSLGGKFWVEIRSNDAAMRNLYNGLYIFGKTRSSIININNGEVLPVTGFGKSFDVYLGPYDSYD